MTWDDDGSVSSTQFNVSASSEPVSQAREQTVELVGTHLRLTGTISLGRFGRLNDLINASSGYVRIHAARLLERTGTPTRLVLSELMVNQDEISFIAEPDAPTQASGDGPSADDQALGAAVERQTRRLVLFTPGHTVSGTVFIFGETDLAAFVDSTHPRFVPMINATTRSLADRKVVSRYPFILINRTQMIAAAEISDDGAIEAAL